MKRVVASTVVVAVLLSLGAAGAASPPATTVSAPTQAMTAIVTEVLGRIDSSFIRSVTVGYPPPNAIPKKKREELASAVWLYVDAIVSDGDDRRTQPQWETWLLAGAVRDIAAGKGLPQVYGLSTRFVLADGTPTRSEGGGPITFSLAIPDSLKWTTESLTTVLAARAQTFGVRLDSVTIQQPYGFAVAVDMTVDEGTLAAISNAKTNLFGPSNQYDGVLYRVRDASGKLLNEGALSSRVAIGMAWYDQSLNYRGSSASSRPLDAVVPAPTPSTQKRKPRPTGPVLKAETDEVLRIVKAGKSLSYNVYSCAVGVVARTRAAGPQYPNGSPLMLELWNFTRQKCTGKDVWSIVPGMSNRTVATIAGSPVLWLSTTKRWIYRAAKPKQGIAGLVVYFKNGIVTQVATSRCVCGGPSAWVEVRKQ
jgi:hypothetical protein